ncbi:excalibur calcium-binding domain-containing protein [Umezawaea sp. Da 62-37]|uniref:excalibur calcium-binding domain-containing protein n=1 Tax=Umezawaea sp. Da 62-37 TaxID=3075927 RepID=UPI0028F70557|nr:excalibur calcium-binding domain-containing protein [Umezawaea sp. Da 62-37]WNV91747.1 excalibur calcium-binding domain-containing protein [Umezawaea sp. Da 62-37]
MRSPTSASASGRRGALPVLLVIACLTGGCGARTAGTLPAAAEVSATGVPYSYAATTSATTTTTDPPALLSLQVNNVVDGRTVVDADGGQVQIAGLAQPGECWAQAAADFTRTSLGGKTVRYSKTVGLAVTVLLPDGSDFAVEAVRRGMGRAEPGSTTALRSAQSAAEQSGAGLWGDPCGGEDSLESQSDSTYKNCAEAKAAGVTPLRTGQPGYDKRLDPDGDGVACER